LKLLTNGQTVTIKATRAAGCGPDVTIVIGDAISAKHFLGLTIEEARRMAERLTEASDFLKRAEFYEQEV